jgi:hypothetical protein
MTKELPPEAMREIEHLIFSIAKSIPYDPLDPTPPILRRLGKYQILSLVRARYGDKAADAAFMLPILTIH